MRRVVLLLAILMAGCAAPQEPSSLPRVMAALGDSIVRATNADAPGDRPAHSFATGHDATDGVDSLAERLARAGAPLDGQVHNLAVSGARVADLEAQARRAVEVRAELVVILVGANDACRRSGATNPERVREDFGLAGDVLAEGLPEGALVYVLSLPDLGQLRELADTPGVRQRWAYTRACDGAFDGSAESSEALDATLDAYNRVFEEEALARGFAWDGGAVHASRIERADLSPVDAFHPSLRGQARLADVAWNASPYAREAP